MRIFVTAKTNAKLEKIECIDKTHYKVAVKASPVEGKANQALIKLLAKYFGVAKSLVVLKSGDSSKQKAFEIIE
ncbi:MAG: DUF167 domain-containing protein [Candidatus Moranbacteria bacterium]|nr:DUF167 domain-containing protein [Candidatus Moranbacteria bacterium]